MRKSADKKIKNLRITEIGFSRNLESADLFLV